MSRAAAVGRSFEGCARNAGVEIDVRGRSSAQVAEQLSTREVREDHPGVHGCFAGAPSIITDVTEDPMEHLAR